MTYSYLLPLIPFLIYRRRGMISSVIISYSIIFFLVLMFINNSVSGQGKRIFNVFYTLLEFSFFTYIVLQNIKSKRLKRAIYISFLPLLASQIVYLNSALFFDTIPIGIETILLFVYIFFFFYEYFRNVYTEYVYNHYCFWVSIGIMLYLGGSFFFYILGNEIRETEIEKYWYLTFIIEIVKNVLFAIAVNVDIRRSKQKNPNQNLPYLDFS